MIDDLEKAGFEAYVVGGCVRDALLNEVPSDWDICTNARPEEMLRIFKDYKVIPTGLKHGTVTVIKDHLPMEVTTYRVDGIYEDHRRPNEVCFTENIIEDLSRRDFTINAMAWHPKRGLVDPFQGYEDLQRRLVRAVGDPWERFEEDGLRIMRFVRFATRLAFDYDLNTMRAVRDKGHLLRFVSTERKREEFDKILLTDHCARGLWDLYELQLFPYILPEKCHEAYFDQENKRHFLDIFSHCALATGIAKKDLVLRLTMFLHDIGKPFTWQRKDNEDIFPDHAHVSAQIANDFLRNLRYDNKTRRQVVMLVACHNDILLDEPVSVRRLLRKMGKEGVQDLIEVKIADILSHRLSYNERVATLAFFAKVQTVLDKVVSEKQAWAVKDLALDGSDMIALGYQQKEIGLTLEKLLDRVIEDPEKNNDTDLRKVLQDFLPGWSNENEA